MKGLKTLKKRQKQIYAADKKVKDCSNVEEMMKALLKSAVKLSKAESGAVFIRSGNANYLQIFNHNLSFLDGEKIHAASDLLPVRAWRDKKKYFYLEFQDTSEDKLLDRDKKTLLDEKLTTEKATEKYREWIKTIGSLALLPIYSGDGAIGAISLHHKKRFWFTQDRLDALEKLLNGVRWFIKYRTLKEKQTDKEQVFLHEVRSVMGGLNRELQSLELGGKINLSASYATELSLNLQSLQDLGRTLSIVNRGVARTKDASFPLQQGEIRDVVRLYKQRLKLREQKLREDISIAQNIPLVGNVEDFRLILRIVLDNAVKFGVRRGDIQILVNEKRGTNRYEFIIRNSGKISQKALEPGVYSRGNSP